MGKLGKFIIWFIFVIGLKICKSSVFHINKNINISSNDTGPEIISFNDSSSLKTFQNDSTNNLVVSTETPSHHKVKRSILVYKQKTLKIQVPDAPLYISSGHESEGGEAGMPISLMLKSPEHSLKNLPHLIQALKTSSQHLENGEKLPESNAMHLRAIDPEVTGNESKPGMYSEKIKVEGPYHYMDIQHIHNRQTYPEVGDGTHQNSSAPANYTTTPKSENIQGSPDPTKMKYTGEPYHPSKYPFEARLPYYQEHPDRPDHRQFEPVPQVIHHYPIIYPHDGRYWNVIPENARVENQQVFANRVGPERMPGVEVNMNPGSQWNGSGGSKGFDNIKKDTSNLLTKKQIENKVLMPLKQSLGKRDGSTNLFQGTLVEPKLNPMQDLTNGVMNYQTVKLVKLPPNTGNKDFRPNAYNDLHAPPPKPSNSGYEESIIDSRSYKTNFDPNVNHVRTVDKYVISGTEEPEMSFDDKGNLLFLKKQTLEILVPKFLINYTLEGATTAHYEPVQQRRENNQINPTGNPANKPPPRINARHINQNEREKDYYMQRYVNKRRTNRDIKATFWHNRGLEDQLISKTSSPIEKRL